MASEEKTEGGEKAGMSKVRLAIGAASLFLFIVGLKRSYRADTHGSGADEGRPRGGTRVP